MAVRHTSLLGNLAEINWFIVLVMSSIAAVGFAMMVSASGGSFNPWATAQISRFAIAFVGMLILALIPMRMLMDYAYLFYFACLLILLGVDIMGHIGMGARRWLSFGGVNLQPSEFTKLAVILVLARYYHQLHPDDIQRFGFLIVPLMLIAMPAVLILRQPNLGTTTIMASVGIVMCFLAGVRWRYFIGAAVAGLSALPLLWHFMHDYQKRRVMTFLNPGDDPLGAGYNILQSIIAIGSGGLFGKGYLQGTQSQLNFLPEKHTDFIFTMLAEEFGFIGCLVVLGLFFVLLMSGIVIAVRSRSTFGALMASGVTAMIFLHVLINCSMVMGMMPVVGVPLPLMSYGGSIMVSTVLAVGLLLNAYTYRDQLPMRMMPKL